METLNNVISVECVRGLSAPSVKNGVKGTSHLKEIA